MSEKSVREMSAAERTHHSLSARVFHATVIGSILLGLVALAIGLGLYIFTISEQYVSESFNLSLSAAKMLEKMADPEPLTTEVMEIYRGLSKEERTELGAEAYHSRFAGLTDRTDYKRILSVLNDFREANDVNDIYLAVYDQETSAIVYIVDPDDNPDTACLPGDWDELSERELNKVLNWDGASPFYDISYTEKYGWLCTSGVPAPGSVPDTFVLTDITMNDFEHRIRSFLFQYVFAMFVAINLFAFFLVRRMRRTLVNPINAIAKAAQDYVRDKKAGTAVTNHFAMLNIRTGDEVENLGLVMADMERDLSEYEENLTLATAERERIGTELSLARRIQADMLPNVFPPFPERTDFDIFATMIPAKEVGGDFYDFFLIDDDHLGLVMADVSGKGVPAALFMTMAKNMLQNYTLTGRSPKQVLEKVNEQICRNNHEEMFVTVWLGVLDLTTGQLTAANAGHEYPILKQPDGAFELFKDKHGFVLGGMEGMQYTEYELHLAPGAKLFLYTDGVLEATDAEGNLFGIRRTLDALNQAADRSPQTILASVDSAAARFVGDAEQFDDLTMLCVHYRGKGVPSMKELTIDARIESLETVVGFVNTELEALNCPKKAQIQIDVAIDELFSNIAFYAYDPDTGPATVRVEVEEDPTTVIITFLDHGKPFDPLAKADPDISLSAEDRPIGGLGIFMVKKTMDAVSYEYKDGQNILRIRKNM